MVIENLDQIVDSTIEENGFIFHPKEIYLMETDQMGTDHLETFFFKVSKKFYANRLIDAYKEVDEIKHIYIEHLFYERLKKLNIRAFKYPLHIIGNSGTSGKPYLESQNAIRREQIFCAMGAHHLKKNGFEKILTALLGWLLKSRKKFKKAKLFRKST